ncbi:hypothetical protein K9L67_02305 [Candidatus Woesearchaeota archaeon]|nr:hypothetical protein [Candidatus Woesearchaeota archaeon]MCF7901037.1 hypothetical protein [Candidatus Woesearchaeota archaeon]MCF8013382.1 hypothetical protein [Candidatus Woesearchaeota archaeon]
MTSTSYVYFLSERKKEVLNSFRENLEGPDNMGKYFFDSVGFLKNSEYGDYLD